MSVEGMLEGCGSLSALVTPHGHALPGDKPQWPRDRAFDRKHTAINVKLDLEDKRVFGTVTHSIAPYNDGLGEVELDGVDLQVDKATVAGKTATFTNDGRTIRVKLPAALPRGKEVKVAVTFSATPRVGMYFIAADDAYPDKPTQVWTQGQDEDSKYWFPCIDSPNGKSTTEVIATVPGSWYVLSNGRLLDEKTNRDGTKTFHWYQERPHATYLITLAAGEFDRIDASRKGLTIDYFVEPAERASGELTFKNTPAMVDLFEDFTGVKFPWAKYSQIVVRDFVFGGMENTSATTMTENILLDRKATRDFSSDPLISHELAHMWFGDLLTCRDWSHGWLNEGFATFLEMLWTEKKDGENEYIQEALTNTELYVGERYRRPVVSNVWNEPIDVFDRHLYEKGSLVLYMLRHLVGDDEFVRSIRRYCADNQDRNVVTQDLIQAFADETGRHLDWFFDQWVFKPGHPKLRASWNWDEKQKVATVTLKQTQDTGDGTPVFRLPMSIDFKTGRGRPKSFDIVMEDAEQSFVFALPSQPDICRVDPYFRVLKELEFEKSSGELLAQLRDDDSIHGRAFAAEGLGRKGGVEAIAALETAVMNDRFWGVQAAAAKALGAIKTEAARDALIRCSGVRNHKARRAVVAALGEFHGDEIVLGVLSPIAARDQSWFVEAEANKSAGKLRVEGSFDVLARNFERPSFRQVVRNGVIEGLVELRDERGFDMLERASAYGAPFQGRVPAVNGLAKLVAYFEARKKSTADRLVELLDDPDFRVRIAASNGLKTIGDATYAKHLDRMAERELDGRGVRMGRENARALRNANSKDGETQKLRDELEKLRRDNQKLKERMDKIEAK